MCYVEIMRTIDENALTLAEWLSVATPRTQKPISARFLIFSATGQYMLLMVSLE